MKQNAITMNNNNESKYIQVKACMSQCQNSSNFLSLSYLTKTADVIMNFFSPHNTTDHT